MKVQLEPKGSCVEVTIENDDDAREFCRVAGEIMDSERANPNSDLRKIYAEYGEKLAENNTQLWARTLWDYPMPSRSNGVTTEVPFGATILSRLGII